MKKGILIGMMSYALLSAQSFAASVHMCNFAPENNLYISADDKNAGTMTEERFNKIIDRVEAVYKPIVKTKGGNLVVQRNWTDGTVNAYASRSGSTWNVAMFGGLARHKFVTDDGFMMVVCHELGHHIGGAPKKGGWGSAWASNEGQSDYFATLKCMRAILETDDNETYVANMTVDASASQKCEAQYKSSNEIALCKRLAMGGKSLAMLLGDLGGNSNVNFNTPDTKVVKTTDHNHPQAQCRLDTYFQGALCDKSLSEDVDDRDATKGVCIQRDTKIGTRPLCWYKPSAQEL
ncbi:MAG: hypothetical protein L6Q33_15615 [Bacteriovoracaceae bacterium]|jgi:hypothetical protein|nr:hypothetical protein [Bacteriovoracaceae bacterium]